MSSFLSKQIKFSVSVNLEKIKSISLHKNRDINRKKLDLSRKNKIVALCIGQ